VRVPPIILHHVDVLNNEYISGWAFNRLLPGRPLRLTFQVNGELLGTTTCSREREDVRQSGLHGTGICGFEYRFPQPLPLVDGGAFTIGSGLPGHSLRSTPLTEIQAAATPGRPIFFMHIPKTAGTSFNNHVHGWFGYGKWHSHIEVLPMETQAELLATPQYVAGHLPFHRLRRLPLDLEQIDFHTILREPYRQIHSHLAWLRGIGSDPGAPFFRAHPPAVRELAIELASRDLSTQDGLADFASRINGFQCDFFDNIQVRYLLDHRPERVTGDDLSLSLEHLSRFSTIGVTERYQEYLSRCASYYGLKHLVQRTRHNPARVAPMFDSADSSIRSALYPLVRHDLKLYQRVLEQLDNQQ
jgi:hypothetical protein